MNDSVIVGEDGVARCWWGDSPPIYRAYHDGEWGMPVADDVRLFEKLSLEGCAAKAVVERARARFERPAEAARAGRPRLA